ncbi:MAG: GIY-YIG nuclease family protein [Nitrospinae bacterium]|nr:GIY-YIG nuclease family protein [Nitrospinota bacterium]MBI3814618.1 GIY-YIG nuclease family protein [Nitrospinota bacterium]
MQKLYYTYIATNKRDTVLYTGITSNLVKRMYQHKEKIVKGFTEKYNVNKLIYYEVFNSPQDAIASEKKIKGWTRAKKIQLIKIKNPEFKDLMNNEN